MNKDYLDPLDQEVRLDPKEHLASLGHKAREVRVVHLVLPDLEVKEEKVEHREHLVHRVLLAPEVKLA